MGLEAQPGRDGALRVAGRVVISAVGRHDEVTACLERGAREVAGLPDGEAGRVAVPGVADRERIAYCKESALVYQAPGEVLTVVELLCRVVVVNVPALPVLCPVEVLILLEY
mgnify:CR=1 FL=1